MVFALQCAVKDYGKRKAYGHARQGFKGKFYNVFHGMGQPATETLAIA
jgi:hypothetical protein